MDETKKVSQEEFQKNAEQQQVETPAGTEVNIPMEPPTQGPQPKLPKINSKMLRNVTITVTQPDKEPVVFESLRNLIELKNTLLANEATKTAGADEKINIKIVFNFENSDEHPVLVEGPFKTVMEFIDSNTLTTQTGMRMLQHLCVRLIETSPLKCGVVTFLWTGNQVGGVGLLNEALEVDSGSINAFISAAEGQIDMYKEQMKKNGIELINDKNRIIIPGK